MDNTFSYTVSIFRVGQMSVAPLYTARYNDVIGGNGATKTAHRALTESKVGDGNYIVVVYFKGVDELRMVTATIRKPVVTEGITITNGYSA